MTKIYNQQQLIDAASKVFGEKGYDAARIEDIANELGVLQGSLYYHIGSKAGLLRLIRVRRFEDLTAMIEAIAFTTGPADEKLRLAALTHLRFLAHHPDESPSWFQRIGDAKRTAQEVAEDDQMTQRFRRCWKSILEQGVNNGQFRSDLEIDVTVMWILGMLNFFSLWYDSTGPRSVEQLADAQSSLILGGLTIAVTD